MKDRFLASKGALAAAIIALASAPLAAQAPKPAAAAPKPAAAAKAPAKAYVAPKTPWGDPDLQGTYTSDDYIGVGLNRQAQFGDRLYLTEQEREQRATTIQNTATTDLQEFAAPDARFGTGPPSHWAERAKHPPMQTSLVVDPPNGQMPAALPEARLRRVGVGAGNNDPRPDGPEDFSYYIRCITRGPAGSILPVIYGNGTQIVQGPGYVVLLQEMVHEARVIPLGGSPHAGPTMRSYMGDSRGHWEGNTLVVETTNLLPNKTGLGGNGGTPPPMSGDARLIEHFTRTAADTIKYELTVNDPKTWERPFTVSFPITAEPGYQNFEYACHEGNYAMFNSLSGARAQDKADAAKK
jgi:hypothetical protein